MNDTKLWEKAKLDYYNQDEVSSCYIKYRSYPINETSIVYESFRGIGMTCNPYALFLELLNGSNPYKHIWLIGNHDELLRLKDEYKEHSNVVFVLRDQAADVAMAIATSKYLVQNNSLPHYFAKREEQIVISTWHGIALKKIGYDAAGGGINAPTGNVVRSFLQSDYILSPNKFMTDVLKKSFKLQGLYNGKIVQEGYPRTDLISKTGRDEISRKLARRGIKIEPGKKIILYAPTWRGGSPETVQNTARDFAVFFDTLRENISTNFHQILIKPHYLVYNKLEEKEKEGGSYIPAGVDATELLSLVDILITDYSSISFDFLITDRPILFYLPDVEKYEKLQGLNFRPEELPGPFTDDLFDLCKLIREIDTVDFSNHAKTKAWACKHDDGNVSKKIIDIIFNCTVGHNVFSISGDKTRLLFYQGIMKTGGVPESFFSLVSYLDYDKFDVTVYCKNDVYLQNANRITDKSRVLVRVGTCLASVEDHYKLHHMFVHGFGTYDEDVNKTLLTEFIRCFGSSNFDYVIDFSGYGVFFASMLSMAHSAKKIIWQHNELGKDFNHDEKIKIRGQTTSSQALLTVYERYDKIVSCGESLVKVNQKEFSGKRDYNKYCFVNNPINIERIQRYLEFGESNHVRDDERFLFVNVGRLSPEKNQVNLIKAFGRFCKTYPGSKLYIIGEDEYKGKIQNLVGELSLNSSVILTGGLENPYSLMSICDCFVFPSLYEGNSVVVNEARYLKLPIIMSNYSTAYSSCVPNGQLLIGFSEDDIYEGLLAFANGEVPKDYEFDAKSYNEKCRQEFLALFEQ